MKVLIVHAHHESKSFCSALFRQAAQTLSDAGHEVSTLDLYNQQFDPASDRRNFKSVHDADYLKQQTEERHASQVVGFAPDLECEIQKLETCDLLVFSFPMWWFALPAILKGWVDRVFAMQRVYGGGKFYENGLGKARKRAMINMTTGSGRDAFSGYGVNPSLDNILVPIEHGIFWFNGFVPLDPFVAFRPARTTFGERAAHLKQLDERLRNLEHEKPRQLPRLSDFPGFGRDQKKRFMVTATQTAPSDERYESLIPAEIKRVAELKRRGIALSIYMGSSQAEPWRGFPVFRESGAEQVRQHLETLHWLRISTLT